MLTLPDGSKKILLHSCCAPCSGSVLELLVKSNLEVSVFFYNPNIHPKEEYELRKRENITFAQKLGVPFIDGDYNTEQWFSKVTGLENEPERGVRCSVCFDFRFERTAQYAKEHGFKYFTSCLGISRWKDFEQITRIGNWCASRHTDLHYWDFNWRKQGGSSRMIEIAKAEEFYQQEYCGCVYSLRDTNRSRSKQGRERIKRGITFYSKKPNQKKDQDQFFD
ncbi:MAG: epoxyqueuosine reductase QueH [Methylacidiphilales bacterium]|nr:epoxyqueuosine reductase QueH [Candidatus Methylacidiphilales bacterium]